MLKCHICSKAVIRVAERKINGSTALCAIELTFISLLEDSGARVFACSRQELVYINYVAATTSQSDGLTYIAERIRCCGQTSQKTFTQGKTYLRVDT